MATISWGSASRLSIWVQKYLSNYCSARLAFFQPVFLGITVSNDNAQVVYNFVNHDAHLTSGKISELARTKLAIVTLNLERCILISRIGTPTQQTTRQTSGLSMARSPAVRKANRWLMRHWFRPTIGTWLWIFPSKEYSIISLLLIFVRGPDPGLKRLGKGPTTQTELLNWYYLKKYFWVIIRGHPPLLYRHPPLTSQRPQINSNAGENCDTYDSKKAASYTYSNFHIYTAWYGDIVGHNVTDFQICTAVFVCP